MSVHVTLRGRLGNNLFQYSLGRIIAEGHGWALKCVEVAPHARLALSLLPLAGPSTLSALTSHFPDAPLAIAGHNYETPVESYELLASRHWRGQTIPFRNIIANLQPRQIRLDGYFQRWEYYAADTDRIRGWFRSPAILTSDQPPTDVVVNIRRGADYEYFRWVVPAAYYVRALNTMSDLRRVHVCGTGIDDTIRAALARFDPVYVEGLPIEHFNLMRTARRLVLSNSTFAWWAAFLSDAVEIYAPTCMSPSQYAFSGFEDVDLRIRRKGYREVDASP
jgi:hypothetical protein